MIFTSRLCFRWYSRGTVYFSVDSLCSPTRAYPDYWQYCVLSGYKSTRRRRESGLSSGAKGDLSWDKRFIRFSCWQYNTTVIVTAFMSCLKLACEQVINFDDSVLWLSKPSAVCCVHCLREKSRFNFRGWVVSLMIEVKLKPKQIITHHTPWTVV